MRILPRIVLANTLFALLPFALNAEDARGVKFFEDKIRPVLVEHCYACHSAEAQAGQKLKGGLLLDSRQGMAIGGDSGPAVVPGKVDESLILDALAHTSFEMPPSGKLPQAVIDDFTHWVKIGAPDPRDEPVAKPRESIDFATAREFWSFQPPKKASPPATKNTGWPVTDIDRFVLATLEQNRLAPVATADKRTLLRRASFDLIGLPPTPEEMQAFLADESTDAFAKVVDRLLASPHYGERWGRHWLDVARYAEDQAHTFGVSRRSHAHEYRDWVIKAFNEDMPYDQFVKLQLAGDLIAEQSADPRERLAGLGLLGLGAIYYKNSDKAKAIADELDDRIDTVTRGFLGLTVSCARCHDHKYDPIPTEDYYSLAGVFHNTRMTDAPLVSREIVETYKQAEKVVKEHDNAIKEYRKQRKIELAEQQRQQVANYMTAVWIYQQRNAKEKGYSTQKLAEELNLEKIWLDRWNSWLANDNKASRNIAALEAWRALPTTDGSTDQPGPDVLAAAAAFQEHLNDCLDERDGKIVVAAGNALYKSGKVNREQPLVDIRVELKGAKKLFLVVTDAGDGDNSDWADWLEPELVNKTSTKSLLELTWRNATSSHHQVLKNRNCGGEPLKVNNKSYTTGIGTHSLSVIEYDLPNGFTHFIAQGGLDGSGAGSVEFRVYTAPPKDITRNGDSPELKARKELLKAIFSDRGLFSLGDNDIIKKFTQEQSAHYQELNEQLKSAQDQMPAPYAQAHVVQDTGQKNFKVYIRGNPDRPGAEAPRRFLRILSDSRRMNYEKGSGRLELANDIASADNPLTARVIVNRIWQHHFGRGLVATTSNFGKLGDPPTHPKLLDWLAVRFMESGWSMKWLHREIMRSAVYQLSSELDTTAVQQDPENRLYWRMSRRRLDVEVWRDALLMVAGNLDQTMGGPTQKLSDANNRRRTVYGAVSRHDLDGLLRLFDFPDANVTSASRTETTVPQQQLFVLNSDFFIAQAKSLSARLQQDAGDDNTARIQLAYERLYGRPATPQEIAIGTAFVTQPPLAEDKLTRWEQYTQALLGANEFLYID